MEIKGSTASSSMVELGVPINVMIIGGGETIPAQDVIVLRGGDNARLKVLAIRDGNGSACRAGGHGSSVAAASCLQTDLVFIVNLEADNDRGAKVADIIERAGALVKGKIKYAETDEKTIEEALFSARKNGKKLLVTGSFHTVEKFMNYKKINKINCLERK